MRRAPVKGRVRTVAIVPAAGSGRRLGLRIKKPFVVLKGKPIIARTLSKLGSSKAINGIIVAVERSSVDRLRAIVRRYSLKKVIAIVAGGRTRFESVRNCLDIVDRSFDVVLIHDGARPFVDERTIARTVDLAYRYGACIAAVPEVDTVKRVGVKQTISATLPRREIYRAQTPQAFIFDIIKRAYASSGHTEATDDASLVERLGKRVKIAEGSYRNIKITTREDLKLAEVLL